MVVSDAINQDEVSPAKVIDNALTNIENEASQLIKETHDGASATTNDDGSGSGAGGNVGELGVENDSALSAIKISGAQTRAGDSNKSSELAAVKDGQAASTDVNKALKEATQNSPEVKFDLFLSIFYSKHSHCTVDILI